MGLTFNELYDQMSAEANAKRQLLSASFELTSRCNFQCKMCYVCSQPNDKQAKSKELSADQWIQIAEEARNEGLFFVTLTGGEVFLREDFREIYERLMQLGFIIKIYTNGSLIKPEVINWLKAIPPSVVSISLYGSSSETYEKVTGHASGYERTVKAIDGLRSAGIKTEIKTTVVQGNMHDFDALSEFAVHRNLGLNLVNYISPRREGCNSDPVGNRLSPDELFLYEVHFTERNRQLARDAAKSQIQVNDSGGEDAAAQIQANHPNDAFRCSAGKCASWVTWDGRLLPCGIMDKLETYPLKVGFKAAWEEIKSKCDLVPVCIDCVSCKYLPYCETCPARRLNETGGFDKPPGYLCELARKRFEHNTNDIQLMNI